MKFNPLYTILVLFTLSSCVESASCATSETKLASPSGDLCMAFELTGKGEPRYSLNYKDTPVVLPSHLGFELRGVLKAQKIVFDAQSIQKVDAKPTEPFDRDFALTPCYSLHSMRLGLLYSARRGLFSTITTKWRSDYRSQAPAVE